MPWSRVLYLQQPFEDNYVDDSFLDSLVLNANVTSYKLQTLCCSTASILRQLCLVVIFVNVWWKVQLNNDFRLLAAVGVMLFCCNVCQHTNKPLVRLGEVMLQIPQTCTIIFPLGVLAPFLQALTRSWSDDTIGTIATVLLVLHVVLYDYADTSSAESTWSGLHEEETSAVFLWA
ncbi:PIGC [Symbiodinium pilosum]|uniref:PIGC protein n=1 Tax=Symbiodinium pilosum TaxID=2952 RepID=A0A812YQK0_SYMPI|nr:PIGC [Symbiodinium pilosum]